MNAIVSTGLKTGIGLLGDAASKAYGTVSKTGKAMGALADTLKDASQNTSEEKQSPPSNVIIGNFGMAGSAGRQRVAGSGTIPAPKAVAKTSATEKMPTEALLDSVVKYLTSIDKSLKSQLELDKRLYDQQARDSQEAIIEEKKPNPLANIKDRLSGFGSKAKDSASTLGTIAKVAAGLGVAAALVASSLDTKELDQLKANVDAFKQKFEWLSEIPAGGLAGFLIGVLSGKGLKGKLAGGLKGGIIGILTTSVAEIVIARMTGNEIPADAQSSVSMIAGGYAAYRIGKTGFDLYKRGQKVQAIRSAPQADPRLRGSGFRDPRTGRAVSTAAARSSKSWLSGPVGSKFVKYIAKKRGMFFVKKIIKLLAKATVGLAITATGVGAIPGLLWTGLSLVLAFNDVNDLINLWYDFQDEEKIAKDAEAITSTAAQPDAVKSGASAATATPALSKSETGRPEEAQAFFESKGWTKEQAAGIVGNLVVESRLKTDALGDGGQAYGIAQWHPPRQAKFRQVYGKDIRQSSFREQLEYVNWELNNSEKAAGNALRQATTASEAAAIVDKKYERSAGYHLAERVSNANAIMAGDYAKLSTGGASGYDTSSSVGDMAGKVVTSGIETMGKMLGALGSTIIKPGIARTTPNVSEKINNQSMKLQNDITFGVKKEKAKDTIKSPTMPSTVSGQRPLKSFSSMDPNYKNIDVLTKYLAHFKMAAT